jgi:hypothetical protein
VVLDISDSRSLRSSLGSSFSSFKKSKVVDVLGRDIFVVFVGGWSYEYVPYFKCVKNLTLHFVLSRHFFPPSFITKEIFVDVRWKKHSCSWIFFMILSHIIIVLCILTFFYYEINDIQEY